MHNTLTLKMVWFGFKNRWKVYVLEAGAGEAGVADCDILDFECNLEFSLESVWKSFSFESKLEINPEKSYLMLIT